MLYIIQVIESFSIHRFVPFFRKHVKLRPQWKCKRTCKKVLFMLLCM